MPAPQGTTPTDPTAVDATVTDTTAPVAADATPSDPTLTDPAPAEAPSTEAPSTETTPAEATTATSATPVVAAVGYGGPAPAAPVAYGQPAYGQPAPATGTDGMSIAALITGILGMGLIPLILGILGLKRTKANGTSGRGLAIAGIVLGALEIVAGIILTISLIVGGAAVVDAVNEANAAASAAAEDIESLEPAPTEEEVVEDDTLLSETPLKDVIPLEAGGFTSAGLTDEATVLAAGALEAYATSYTDGTDTVVAVVSDWATAEDATAFATAQSTAFTPEQLVDQGSVEGVNGQYWMFLVDGVTTVVATNESATLTFAGPEAAVVTLYQNFPV